MVANAAVEEHSFVRELHVSEGPRRRIVVTGDASIAAERIGERSGVSVDARVHFAQCTCAAVLITDSAVDRRRRSERRRTANHVDDAADRVCPVEHGRRAAHDLHTLDARDVDERWDFAKVLLATRIVQANAVLEQQNALAALAANHRPGLIHAGSDHIHAGKFAQQIGRRVRQSRADHGAVKHVDRLGHIVHVGLLARRGHRHGAQRSRAAHAVGVRGRAALLGGEDRRNESGRSGQGAPKKGQSEHWSG